MSKKLWGGRFSKPALAAVEEYTASIRFDYTLAYEDVLGSLVHAKMLARCNLISNAEYKKISYGLTEIAQQISRSEVEFSIHDEDVHMNIERLLHKMIGEVAGKLHTARSRNDQVALDLHLYLRRQTLVTARQLLYLQETLFNLAKKYSRVILPGYTHLQRAQPVYLSAYFMAYFAMFQRDIERLQNGFDRINVSPLGAAALAGTHFKIDKQFTAEELAFDAIYINTLDAVSDRDFIIEFTAACSLIMLHISRLSEELILWSSQEFNFINFDEAYCTGSSIMPQKKNPDVAELGRGKTGRVYGALVNLLTLLKALPLAYNKDLQEDKEPLFDVIKTIQQTLAIYPDMLSTLQINTDNMLAATKKGYLNATALAEYLVQHGLAFRIAHKIVGEMVAFCCDQNCLLEELTLEQLNSFSPLFDERVYPVMAIKNMVEASDHGNIKNKSDLENQLRAAHVKLTTTKNWIKTKSNILTEVYKKFGLHFADNTCSK